MKKVFCRRKTAVFVFGLLMSNLIFGQGVSLTHYNVADGLPSSEVYDVIQDQYGYMWFCTDKGLSRYNGYEFKNYDKNNGAPDNVMFNFFQRENGEIWCTSRSLAIFKISGKNPKFSLYPYTNHLADKRNKSPIETLEILDDQSVLIKLKNYNGFVQISKRGELLQNTGHVDFKNKTSRVYVVKSADKNIFFFSDTCDSHLNIFPAQQIEKLEFPVENINHSATYLQKNEVAAFSDGNRLYFKNANGTTVLDSNNTKQILTVGKLTDDVFWVGYFQGGVKLYSYKGELLNHFLPDESVSKIFVDANSNYWITTLYNGVFQLKNTNVKYLNQTLNRRISSLASAGGQGLYIGYVDGNIDVINQDGVLENFHNSKLHIKAIILHDTASNTTYFSTKRLFSSKKEFLISNSSNYLDLDKTRLYYGNASTLTADVNNFTTQTTIFARLKMHDVTPYKNRIYGGNVEGLYFAEKTDLNKTIATPFNTRVDDLNRIGDYLVLGTNGRGVIVINEKHQIVVQFNQSNGLRSNYVNQTFSQNDSTLWVCTNNGLNRIKLNAQHNFNISYVDEVDGLLSNEVWNVVTHEGKVYAGTQKGLNYMPLSIFDQIQTEDTLDFFTWNVAYLNGEPFNLAEMHDFTYNENTIDFHFEAVTFGKKNDFQYRYKLNGLDQKWNLTQERNVRYAGLSPGNYNLIIQAKNRNGKWSQNELHYTFYISPPFWSTWWFLILVLVAAIGVVYLFFKLRILRYNGDIVREILRLIMQRLRNDQPFVLIRDKGNQIKIYTNSLHFVKTNGNYLELHTQDKVYLTRSSIKQFLENLPDAIEYIQVHRSYLVRVDKVNTIGAKTIVILNQEIPIGRKFNDQIKHLRGNT